MRGITTIEWLVIATIVLIAASQVVKYWGEIWDPLKAKAEEKSDEFSETISDLSSSSQPDLPESSQVTRLLSFQSPQYFQLI